MGISALYLVGKRTLSYQVEIAAVDTDSSLVASLSGSDSSLGFLVK